MTLETAVQNRNPDRGLVFHTGRGCQYASSAFRNAAASIGVIQRMSQFGTPYDNACAEIFFKTIKVECLGRRRFNTRRATEDVVMMYILFYNRVRIPQSLAYLSPADLELACSA